MLLANETVASHLEAQDAPTLYRVHEEPDIMKVGKFEEFISGFGYSLGAPLTALRPRHFQKLLERIHGKPEEKPIAFLMLRTMQKARYAPENLGHFGLAASSYTHFTSPIRRYPDLVVHRALARRAPRDADGRASARSGARSCRRSRGTRSEMERRADDAERELLQWKKVRFMADKVGDEFEGYVTGVAAFGLFIELVEHFVEGLVHVSTMADDYYRFVENAHTAARREHAEDVPARRQGRRCRSSASTWTCGRSIWGWSRSSSASAKACTARGAAARAQTRRRAGSSGPAGVRERKSGRKKAAVNATTCGRRTRCLPSCRP